MGGLLQPLEITNGKWKNISMDFIVGSFTTNNGHDSKWVIVDWLSKMCQFVPTKTTVETFKLAWLFVENFYPIVWPTNQHSK